MNLAEILTAVLGVVYRDGEKYLVDTWIDLGKVNRQGLVVSAVAVAAGSIVARRLDGTVG